MTGSRRTLIWTVLGIAVAVLVIAVVLHVAGLWVTSPPDVIDALLFVAPTPFSNWGIIAMWALFATGLRARTHPVRCLHLLWHRQWHNDARLQRGRHVGQAGSAAGLSGALAVAGGAAMSALSGAVLTEANVAWGLVCLMLLAALLGLAAALYVLMVETKEQGRE